MSVFLYDMHCHAALRSRHSLFKPAGSKDAAWSVPFQVRSLVKWRSFHVAPSAYAAMSTEIPRWWPENPKPRTRPAKRSRSNFSSSMHTSWKGTG